MKRIRFSQGELRAIEESPEALEAAASAHDLWEIEADSVGSTSGTFHQARAKLLREVAAFCRNEHEDGHYARFED